MPSIASPPLSGPLPPAGTDTGVLRALLALCGPDTEQELLARLGADLTAVRLGLLEGAGREGRPDRAAIRAQSHVLIAISGTIGAAGVQRLAQGLNDQAQPGRKGRGLRQEALRVASEVEALVAYVAAVSLAPERAR